MAEELPRNAQMKERGSRVTTPAPAPKPAASTSHVKSASSAAGDRRQQQVKMSATDAEPEAPLEVPMEMGTDTRVAFPGASAANTRRKFSKKSAQVAITHHTRRN